MLKHSSPNGFTLIEVLISITILAFLTVSVTQTIRRGVDFKVKIQKNIDERSAINSAMRMIERDINLAFHYQDVTTEVLQQLKKAGTAAPTPAAAVPGAPPVAVPAPVPGATPAVNPYATMKIRTIPNYTMFLGDKDALHFTNLNNIATQGGQNYGDQEEVGYFLKSCKSLSTGKTVDQCLWRRTSPVIDDDVTKGGENSVLIEGVKKFEIRYFGKEKEDWVNHWHSDGKEDANLANKFPQAVEVTLTIAKDKREVSAIRVIPLRFPNNRDAPAATAPGTANPAPVNPLQTTVPH